MEISHVFELLTEEMPVSFSNCYCSAPQPAADRQCDEECQAMRPAIFFGALYIDLGGNSTTKADSTLESSQSTMQTRDKT